LERKIESFVGLAGDGGVEGRKGEGKGKGKGGMVHGVRSLGR